jgi:hypothetical protein
MSRTVARSRSVVQRVDVADRFLRRAFRSIVDAASPAPQRFSSRADLENLKCLAPWEVKRRNIAAELYCGCAILAAGRKLARNFAAPRVDSSFLEHHHLRMRTT